MAQTGDPDGKRRPCGATKASPATGSSSASREAFSAFTRISSGARPSKASASAPSTPDARKASSSQAGATPPSATASPAVMGAGAWGPPSNKSARLSSPATKRNIAARPLTGTGPHTRIARYTSSRTLRRSPLPA